MRLVPVTRLAVVGHVEWVQFARVARLPLPGEIVHASDSWEEAAGGAGVAAVQLARLGGAAELFTALGDDAHGAASREQFPGQGVTVHAAARAEPTRRAFTFTDDDGERTITVIGERLEPRGADPLPWGRLEQADAVYFTAGDADALRHARRARVLVATPRAGAALTQAGVKLDALVHSATDPGERLGPALDPPPALVVGTGGERGGTYAAEGKSRTYAAAPLPGPVVDAYGCGDSFAAGLTFGLGAGLGVPEALALAARAGAACITGRGPYGAQLGATAAGT